MSVLELIINCLGRSINTDTTTTFRVQTPNISPLTNDPTADWWWSHSELNLEQNSQLTHVYACIQQAAKYILTKNIILRIICTERQHYNVSDVQAWCCTWSPPGHCHQTQVQVHCTGDLDTGTRQLHGPIVSYLLVNRRTNEESWSIENHLLDTNK